jgi:putative tricarboxylic transport membrane protein
MRAADLITASLLMLMGGVVVFDAVRLGIGWGTDGPKSGFFPFWLGVLMVVACVAIMVQAWQRSPARLFVTREKLWPVLKVLLPAVGLVVIMQWLGLYVSSALYIAFYMRWIGRHAWVTVIACALGMALLSFLVFDQWFLVPLPKGPLEVWLGY